MKKFVRYWLPVLVYMGLIFILSHRQKVALTDSYALSFLIFKTIHVIEYALLYVLCYRAFRATVRPATSASWLAFILIVLYAMSDELHQYFIPTREGKVRDVIIDAIGGGVGWILIHDILPRMPKKLKTLAKRWQLL